MYKRWDMLALRLRWHPAFPRVRLSANIFTARPTKTCGGSSPLHPLFVCNGEADCVDGRDELNCTQGRKRYGCSLFAL